MKIVKDHGPSTLPFDKDEDDDIPHVPNPPYDIPGSSALLLTSNFTFIEDHDNLLNCCINSPMSSINELAELLCQVLARQDAMQTQLNAFYT